MLIKVDIDSFWLWLARFAVKRLTTKHGALIPDGVPTIRDRDSRCWGYEPRKRRLGDWDCQSDGHYLCKECAHYQPLEVEDEEAKETAAT